MFTNGDFQNLSMTVSLRTKLCISNFVIFNSESTQAGKSEKELYSRTITGCILFPLHQNLELSGFPTETVEQAEENHRQILTINQQAFNCNPQRQ